MIPRIKEMKKEEKGLMGETPGMKSTHRTMIIREVELPTKEVAMRAAVATGKEKEESMDDHIRRPQTLTEARTATTGKGVTPQGRMETELPQTPIMKKPIEVDMEEREEEEVTLMDIGTRVRGMEALTVRIMRNRIEVDVEEAEVETETLLGREMQTKGLGTAMLADLEVAEDRGQQAQVVKRIEDPKGGEEGDIEEIVEAVREVESLIGIGEEENEGVVEVGTEET